MQVLLTCKQPRACSKRGLCVCSRGSAESHRAQYAARVRARRGGASEPERCFVMNPEIACEPARWLHTPGNASPRSKRIYFPLFPLRAGSPAGVKGPYPGAGVAQSSVELRVCGTPTLRLQRLVLCQKSDRTAAQVGACWGRDWEVLGAPPP